MKLTTGMATALASGETSENCWKTKATSRAAGAAITDMPARIEAALDRFPLTLGAGQVSAPGMTTTATQQLVMAHAEATRRVALLDAPDTDDVSDVTHALGLPEARLDLDASVRTTALWGSSTVPPWTPRTVGER